MQLIDLNTAPPGEWTYQQPQTGHWMKGITFDQLLGKIVQHRANMNLPVVSAGYDYLMLEIQDWICQNRIRPKDREQVCKQSGPPPSARPGAILSILIHKVTGRHAGGCGICQQRMQQMNEWGWLGCWRERETILSWLAVEAKAQGHTIEDSHGLFRAVFSELFHRQSEIAEQENPAK